MRTIDADAALQDANLNYGGVYDAILMKHFLERQPTVKAIDSGSEGCEACINKYCITCVYQTVDEWSEPCFSCASEHRNYKPTNYCCECGKNLTGG